MEILSNFVACLEYMNLKKGLHDSLVSFGISLKVKAIFRFGISFGHA